MRRWLPLMLLTGCGGQPAIAPGGIVSNNPCIDAVLAEIAVPGQIAAVSMYSHDADSASAPLAWARALPALGTSAEEIIAARPRLVLTGNLASSGTNAGLAKAGVRTVAVGVAASWQEDREQIRTIAKAIDRVEAGEKLVARIEDAIKPLPFRSGGTSPPDWSERLHWVGVGRVGNRNARLTAPTPNPSPKGEGDVSAIIWQNGGFVAGAGTLQDELLSVHGFTNASATYGLTSWDILPLETLIRNPPDIIFMPVSAKGDDARALAARRQLLRHVGGKTRIVNFPDKLLFCGGPTIIKVSRIFAATREAMP